MAAKALDNSLGVIHAIHAHAEENARPAPGFRRMAARLGSFGERMGFVADFRKRHADGKRPDAREVIVAVDGEAFPLDAALDGLIHGFEEIIAVRLDVEADQVGAQQAVEKFRCQGQMRKASGLGQGMCQKIATRASGRAVLDQPRQQSEVIILDQHEGLLRRIAISSSTACANFSFTRW